MNQNIRNFVIIAHIDHGKSTLADRLLEITDTIPKREMRPQYLDQLDLERERGITIKMAPVRMVYHPLSTNNESLTNKRIRKFETDSLFADEYILNLIDTPGHSDFAYEVSRALAAVEGAILLVDATQGIQAQTLANYENAKKAGLTIIGAVNKIDAASHEQIKTVRKDSGELLGTREEEILLVSGKTGEGVEELLKAVIEKIPPPSSTNSESITNKRITNSDIRKFEKDSLSDVGAGQALIFDSVYDDHKGVIAYVRVFDGIFKSGDYKEIGYFTPQLKQARELKAGEIGYIATGVKDPGKIKIGGTIGAPPLPGYREPQPVVFVSFYPEDANDYDALRQALARLRLNDAALHFESDMSEILGRGFKGGFLGRLHFEITAERLARGEFSAGGALSAGRQGSASGGKVKTVHSFPSVAYQIKLKNNGWITITNPKDFPSDCAEVLEPMTKVEILTPPKYLGDILKLKELFRFSDIEIKTAGSKALISAKLPLADLISDLDDKLKSVSEGYASLSYETAGWARAEVTKLEILVTESVVPGLTRIVPEKYVLQEGRQTVLKLKKLLPQEQFAQAIQARAYGRIIARETIPALRKDVTGYLYGGDRTRKVKLWKKQQKGKKKLKERATREPVKIPAHIFKELLKK